MEDWLGFLQFAGRTGLNLCALTTAGLGLHAMAGIVEKPASRRMKVLALGSASALAFFLVVRLATLAAQMSGGRDPFNPGLWTLAWSILEGSTLAMAIGLLIVPAALFLKSSIGAGVGAFLIALSFALTGHTQSSDHPEVSGAILALHVLVAAYWFAAPLTLAPDLTFNDALPGKLRRFSMIAVLAVPAMMVAGIWLTWTLTGSVERLVGSAYGQLLVFKLGLAAAALAAGAYNKLVLTSRLEHGQIQARAHLTMTLKAELTIFVAAVLAVSAATTVMAPDW